MSRVRPDRAGVDGAGLAAARPTVPTIGTERPALLDAAVQAAGEAVLITTADLDAPGPQIVFVNPAACRLTGYAAPELLGRTPRLLQGPKTDRATLDRMRGQLARGEPFAGRAVNYRKDGTEYVVDWQITPVRAGVGADASDARDAVGPITHFVAVQRDVTAEVRAAGERDRLLGAAERARADAEAARAAAEVASRTRSEFLATMSHELRTPLNAILGYAQLLDMGVLGATTPAQHAHLERLQTSARHLLGLVDDVLDVAKVDADRLQVRREVFLTGAAVAAALTLVQPQGTARGVRLTDLGAGEAGVPYVGDEHRVRQILVNLLANAVKFTPAGGQITVSCGSAAEPDPGAWRPGAPAASADGAEAPTSPAAEAPIEWAFVRVEDTGPGLAPDLLPRLFEPFVQGDGALTRERGGTGLGLAISRRLARRMGGDLTVRSRPGDGAVFTLWLPGGARSETSGGGAAEPGDRAVGSAVWATPSRTTPALGSVAVGERSGGPLSDQAYAVLHALGARLAGEAEAVSERYVAALRADGRFPGAEALPAVQLRDHIAPDVGLLATRLMIIGETRGRAHELLGDGGQLQRVMAELHGAQRHRLGWSEADLEREGPLFLAELERAVRGTVDTGPGAGPGRPEDVGGDADDDPEVDGAAVRAAAAYAVDVARAMVAESARVALRAHRFARAGDTP